MVLLDGHSLTLAHLLSVADDGALVEVTEHAGARVDASRVIVDRMAAGSEAVYGINTGFGAPAETVIPSTALGGLQLSLLRGHAAGVGEPPPVRPRPQATVRRHRTSR